MSDNERRSPANRTLDALVAEAKEHLDVPASLDSIDMDWSRIESRLDTEESRISVIERSRPSRTAIALRAGVVFAAAAAAAVALVVRKEPKSSVVADDQRAEVQGQPASALRKTEPLSNPSELRVNGGPITAGYVVHTGDAIEAVGTRAVFERARAVTWLLEQESAGGRARMKVTACAPDTAVGQPLVLGLEQGVVEAEVAPVSEGEAFAVDVATERGVVRVAVHGTHLRVARAGDHVVVDLTEGVIAIGVPPKSGVTTGTVVNAPAHVELDATDLGSLRVDHAPESVRAAVPLPVEGLAKHAAAFPSSGSATTAPPAHLAAAASVATHAKDPVPLPAPLDEEDEATAKAEVPPHVPASSTVKASASPRIAISAAVRACASRVARPSEVRVTVTSSLRLRVSKAGVVESAQFTPPLLPEIQSCAAQAIYKTRLEAETGIITIPLEFRY